MTCVTANIATTHANVKNTTRKMKDHGLHKLHIDNIFAHLTYLTKEKIQYCKS